MKLARCWANSIARLTGWVMRLVLLKQLGSKAFFFLVERQRNLRMEVRHRTTTA
jgi:hypothetical protein